MPYRRLNIISNNVGFGLSRDIGLVRSMLEPCGWQVDTHGFQSPPIAERTRRALRRIVGRRPAYDVNLFIELVIPMWFRRARANILIPNQEWFQERAKRHLKRFDLVLCKTRHGEAIFQALGCRTSFASFTSARPSRRGSCARTPRPPSSRRPQPPEGNCGHRRPLGGASGVAHADHRPAPRARNRD